MSEGEREIGSGERGRGERERVLYLHSFKMQISDFFPFAIFQELRKIVWSGHQLKTTESKQSQNGGKCNFDRNNELNSF